MSKDQAPTNLMSELLEEFAKQGRGAEPFAIVNIHKAKGKVVTEKTPVRNEKIKHEEEVTITRDDTEKDI